MAKLNCVSSTNFYNTPCDFYYDSDTDTYYMTIAQLSDALEYQGRRALELMLKRHEYLTTPEFSVANKLYATDRKAYSTRLFTEDGIYEVTMLSAQPKAREFRACVRRLLKDKRKGISATANNCRNVSTATDVVKELQEIKQLLKVACSTAKPNTMSNESQEYYRASTIGKLIDVYPPKIGLVAAQYGLKTPKYGKEVARGNLQPVFVYNEAGKQALLNIFGKNAGVQ